MTENHSVLRIRAFSTAADNLLRRHSSELHASIVGADDPAELVALTPDDLAELIEDAQAAAAYARSRNEESVPIEVADRLLAGDNPIRVWRNYRGMTLERVATATGLGKGYLSQIERGQRRGTVDILRKLAKALAVDIEDLL